MSNPVMDAILARRSIRRFTDESVSAEELQTLLEAGMAGPSAQNKRPWEFVVVDDDATLTAAKRALPFGKFNAPLGMLVCGNVRRAVLPAPSFWIQDCSAAAENILLAATSLGLGGVWIGIHPIKAFVRGVRKALDLPRYVVPLGMLWIGHPAEEKPPRTQFDEARVHRNGWRKLDDGGVEP